MIRSDLNRNGVHIPRHSAGGAGSAKGPKMMRSGGGSSSDRNLYPSWRIVIFFLMTILFGCAATLEKYKPRSVEEAEIKETLVIFVESINASNIPQLLSVLQDQAHLSGKKDRYSQRRKLTKTEYADYIRNKAAKYYFKVSCGPPEIYIDRNQAFARVRWEEVYPINGWRGRYFAFFNLVRENNKWLITKDKFYDITEPLFEIK